MQKGFRNGAEIDAETNIKQMQEAITKTGMEII